MFLWILFLEKDNEKRIWERLFNLINNAVFGKSMENVRKDKGIKVVTKVRRIIYLILNQIIILQSFSQKSVCNEWTCLSNTFNIRSKQNIE